MAMPESHCELVSEIAKVNPNVVVVLMGGSPVEMPWIADAKAVLNLYLGGGTPADCDKAVERTQLRLPGDIMLPVTVVRETLRFYEETEEPRTAAEAEAAAAAALRQVLLSGMEEGEVEQERIATVPIDGSYLTALEAECREQIGQFVELPRE